MGVVIELLGISISVCIYKIFEVQIQKYLIKKQKSTKKTPIKHYQTIFCKK